MNLFDMAARRDRQLCVDGSVVATQRRVGGNVWRGFDLADGAHLRVRDALRWYPFCERPPDTGWQAMTLDKAPIDVALALRLRERKSRSVTSQVVVRLGPELRALPFPRAPESGDCDLELSLQPAQGAQAFLAVHYALDRSQLIAYCKGRGLELGPGHQPQVLPAADVDVSYLEQSSVAEWQARYNREGKGKYIVNSALWERYQIGAAHALPVDDGSLDFIFSSHVFEHLANPLGHLQYWFGKLRPGGVVAAVVPDLGGCKDYVYRPCPLSDLERELAGGFSPSVEHYARWAEKRAPGKDPVELLHSGLSIHVHFYTRSNIEEVLRYAVGRIGYSESKLWHSRNSKDFHFLLRR
jgi:SAM-dependent methyltransferase